MLWSVVGWVWDNIGKRCKEVIRGAKKISCKSMDDLRGAGIALYRKLQKWVVSASFLHGLWAYGK